MKDTNIYFRSIELGILTNQWTKQFDDKASLENQPISQELYDELYNLMIYNGHDKTICFRYLVNQHVSTDKRTRSNLSTIKFINNNVPRIPKFLCIGLFSTLIPIIIHNPQLIGSLPSMIILFGIGYSFWAVLMIVLFVVFLFANRVLRINTPIKHPHLVYLSLIYEQDKPTKKLKFDFRDNENFYGKNN